MSLPRPSDPSSALDLREREVRQLTDTIVAMRQEMEKMAAATTVRVQQAVAEYRDENVQLKTAIQAMRDEMEQMRAGQQRTVQQASADASAEITHLKGTIVVLRGELDKLCGC